MDLKAKKLCEDYCKKIVEHSFDESDIFGFYIFIRNYPEKIKGCEWIREWADLIAHRIRDRGKVFENIEKAYYNNCEKIEGSNMIKDYRGMPEGTLEKEFRTLFSELGYDISDEALKEIVLCTFSIANFTEYRKDSKSDILGQVRIWQTKDGLGLVTHIQNKENALVWLAGLKGDFMDTQCIAGDLEKPIRVERENGKLIITREGKKL